MVPVNYSLLTGTVPVNNSLLTGTVPINNYFLTGTNLTSKFGAPDPTKMFTLLVRALRRGILQIQQQGAEQFEQLDLKDDTILHSLPLVCRSYSAELVIFVCIFKNEEFLLIKNY